MKILSVLGSNKLATTTSSVFTEIFTGEKPDKILILSEGEPQRDFHGLSDVLDSLNLSNVTIEVKVMGEGIQAWRDSLQNMKDIKIDVADITAGRKYMALAVTVYGKVDKVRYAYLKREDEGYRIFGYVPFEDIEVMDVRSGEKVNFDPPKTKKNLEKRTYLGVEALTSLYNIYSLLGEVEISFRGVDVHAGINDEEINHCYFSSGYLRFPEENELMKKAKEGAYFLADTNSYIRIKDRFRSLLAYRKREFRLLPSRSIYNELLEKTRSTQKNDKSIIKYHLAMSSYRRLHQPPVTTEVRGAGDVKLVEEARRLKQELSSSLYVITSDTGIRSASSSQAIQVQFLDVSRPKRSDKGDIGELMYCLSFYDKLYISVNGEEVAMIGKTELSPETLDMKRAKVEALKDDLNYPYFLSKLEEFLQ